MIKNIQKIVNSRQEDKTTKYTDRYLSSKIETRMTRLKDALQLEIWRENGIWFAVRPDADIERFETNNRAVKKIMKEVEDLQHIIDSL